MLGAVGLPLAALAIAALRGLQFDIVNYRVIRAEAAGYLPPTLFAGLILVAIATRALLAGRATGDTASLRRALAALAPLTLAAPLALYLPASSGTPPFVLIHLLILGTAWAAYRSAALGDGVPVSGDILTPARVTAILAVLIVGHTWIHTRTQLNFFEHLSLGHADFGHHAEELKNALLGRGLRSDSADHHRFGWHFGPLLYALVPLYALWPSPVLLMVLGGLFVHLPALPAAGLASWRTGSAAVGLMVGLTWLLLPSVGRMIYSGTYGFQWVYAALPLIAGAIALHEAGRRRWSLALAALAMLVQETIAAFVFGWGVYLFTFTRQRRAGGVVALAALGYAAICATWIIPAFAEGTYQRLDQFGVLGGTLGELITSPLREPAAFFSRLARREAWQFLVVLLVPMALLPLRGWRMSLAALPTLLPVLLLENAQFLSIKFWQQAGALPILFLAGVAALPRGGDGVAPGQRAGGTRLAAALLAAAAIAHFLLGFSPIGKGFEMYATDRAMQSPDPRYAFVQRLQRELDHGGTVLATERLAVHFLAFDRVYTGSRPVEADYVVIDRADAWDGSGLAARAVAFAAHPEYRLRETFGSILLFERAAPRGD